MAGKGGRRATTWNAKWNHGTTKHIRVPAALESQIMEYARALDCGQRVPIDSVQLQTETLLAIDQFVENRLRNFHPNQYSRVPGTHTRRWDELRKFRDAVASGDARSGSSVQSQSVIVHQ